MQRYLKISVYYIFWMWICACSSEEKEVHIPLEISKESIVASNEGLVSEVTVTTSRAWKITVDAAWVKFSPSSGQGTEKVSIKVYSNQSEEERKTIAYFSTDTETVQMSVSQSGVVSVIQVSPVQKNVRSSGEEFNVSIQNADGGWEVEIPASAQSWITLNTKDAKTAVFTAKLNNNGVKRTGELLFKDTQMGKVAKLAVSQDVFTSTVANKKWSEVATRLSDSWYATNEAKEVAENVLLYQKDCGGWYKNIEMHHLLTDKEKEAVKATKSEKACFDNGATTTELRFLAKMYKQNPDDRYRKAFIKGLDYIMNAQYSSGGWPQYYPLRGGYSDNITFNDDLMVNLLRLLKDVYQKQNDFISIVEEETIQKARTIFDKGVDCILKCQIVDDGIKTFWCAQHDPTTLDPAVGRPHEFPSFSGMEGSEVLEFLMEIENPTTEIKEAVVAAANWLEAHKIPNKKVVDVKDASGQTIDRKVEDRTGEDMWGRFIQLGGEVAKRVYTHMFNNVLGDKKGWITLDDGTRIIYQYKNNAEESYNPAKAYQPIYGIYDSSRPFLLYRFLYVYEDAPTYTDKNGYEVPTSLDASNRKSYQYVGNWPQKILREKYPEWKNKHGI